MNFAHTPIRQVGWSLCAAPAATIPMRMMSFFQEGNVSATTASREMNDRTQLEAAFVMKPAQARISRTVGVLRPPQ